MFAKLLKHDFNAVMKHWWIGAVASVFIAMFGGVCNMIANVDYTKYEILPTLGMIAVFVIRAGMYLFPLFSMILVIIRYYKHFFTDEGYLTFTLPVKKRTLLDSKILVSIIFNLMSSLVCSINLFLIAVIGDPEVLSSRDALYELSPDSWFLSYLVFGVDSTKEFFSTASSFAVPYIILYALVAIGAVIVETLFIYGCITLAASLVKKYKILVAVGLYYGVSSVVSFVVIIFVLWGVFSVYSTSVLTDILTATESLWFQLFLLTGILGMIIALIGGLYLLLTYLLDKKLNLE